MANANDSKSKSDAYNQAVTRATGGAAGGKAGELMTPPPSADVAMMLRTYEDPRELQAAVQKDLASGGFEAAPQIMSLKEGQVIEGILEGNGPVAEFTDSETGEVTHVQTWVIADPTGAVRISILSSAQLDRKLIGFIGGPVKIARGKDVNVAGTKKRMTEYMVWGPRLAGGKKRQWFELSNVERAQLEASSANGHRPALPAPAIEVPDVTPTPAAS